MHACKIKGKKHNKTQPTHARMEKQPQKPFVNASTLFANAASGYDLCSLKFFLPVFNSKIKNLG